MPAKKTKETIKEKVTESDSTVANTNAIGALTEIANNQHSRMKRLEDNLEEVMKKLGQVLSRLGL